MEMIDVKAAKQFAEEHYYPCLEGYVDVKVINDFLDKCPKVEAEPIIEAHWYRKEGAAFHQCSNCNNYAPDYDDGLTVGEDLSDRCPSCGAHMDEEVEIR